MVRHTIILRMSTTEAFDQVVWRVSYCLTEFCYRLRYSRCYRKRLTRRYRFGTAIPAPSCVLIWQFELAQQRLEQWRDPPQFFAVDCR